MKKIINLLLSLVLFVGCKSNQEPENKDVYIKGSIANYEQDTLFLSNYSTQSLILKEEVVKIPLINKSEFEYRFKLDSSAYFRVGRTFLYLSPGDSLIVSLDTKSREVAAYEGKGANANLYLTELSYPKGGSYWGEREVSSKITDYKEMPEAFKKVYDARLKKLEELKGVPESFKEIERARLKFDYVNTLQATIYLYYRKMRAGEMNQDEMNEKMKEADSYLLPYMRPYLDDFNNTEYLQLESYHSVLFLLKNEELRKELKLPDLSKDLKEYVLTNDLIRGFNIAGYNKEFLKSVEEGIKEISNQEYVKAIRNEQDKYVQLAQGQKAKDLVFEKLDASAVKLSDYKGKTVVVDLWATWCGPCMQEKPFFEELEEKYNHRNDLVFISLSIDTQKIWKNYFQKNAVTGNQFRINRSDLSFYKVASIPRFFVIDKESNIVDVFAPRPSSGKLEELITDVLDN